jgi:lipoyl(octanoyl) transferase
MAEEWYEAQGIEVRETDRGGRVTYHGPGQLVAYPIVSLRPYGDDVHEYVRRLERVAISALADHGVGAQTIEGLTGVWTEGRPPGSVRDGLHLAPGRDGLHLASGRDGLPHGSGDVDGSMTARRDHSADGEARKIASIGVHVSRGVTSHGLAINVNNDLQPFEWVVPCGIEGCRVTSLGRELGAEQDLAAFAADVTRLFGELYDREPVPTERAALGIDGARLGTA